MSTPYIIKAIFRNGVACPQSVVEGHDGEEVLITFVQNGARNDESAELDNGWNQLCDLVQQCSVVTGVRDLAEHHDHYAHGKPKSRE